MYFQSFLKFLRKIFCGFKKSPYLCSRYPENNLFTLEVKLIPVEDLERWPVKVIAFFMPIRFVQATPHYLTS